MKFLWLALAVLVVPALYGLHRLLLRWEERGHIYYLRKKPSPGGGNCLSELQTFLDPPAAHVYHLREEQPLRQEANPGGPGDDLPAARRDGRS